MKILNKLGFVGVMNHNYIMGEECTLDRSALIIYGSSVDRI